LPEGSLVVNSSQGGGSKDTWVLATRTSQEEQELAGDEIVSVPPESPMVEQGPELTMDQQQQQQQQQQAVENFDSNGGEQ
jgi:hypothetical protein